MTLVVGQSRQGDGSATVLALRHDGGPPEPAVRLTHTLQSATPYITIERLRGPATGADRPGHEREVLEHLYAWVMRLDPQARYCTSLRPDKPPCQPMQDAVSHGQALRAVADARQALAEPGAAAVAWRVVNLQGGATPLFWDPDVVGVRVTVDEVPLAGVAVHFNRAPHSLCVARTQADGLAYCRLQDQKADEHLHDHTAPVVATYPGDVAADRVLLPTTQVLPALPLVMRSFGALPAAR